MFRQIFYSFTACVLLISTQLIFGADKYPDTLSFVIQNDEGQTVEEFDIPGADIEKLSGDTKGYIQAFLEWHGYTAGQQFTTPISLPLQYISPDAFFDLISLAYTDLPAQYKPTIDHITQILIAWSYLCLNARIVQSWLNTLPLVQLCDLYKEFNGDRKIKEVLSNAVATHLKFEERAKLDHDGEVTSVAITPDGNRIISGSEDKNVRVWDLNANGQWQNTATLSGHTRSVKSVAMTPDGKRIVSGSWDNTVRVWDLDANAEWQNTATLSGHTSSVYSVAITQKGNRIVSGSWDNTVHVWDLDANRQWQNTILRGHTHYVTSVAITPDGNRIVSGSWDNTLRVWDLDANGEWQSSATLSGHTSSVDPVAITQKGNRIVSGSWDKTVRVWDLGATGEWKSKALPLYITVHSVATTPDGTRIVSGYGNNHGYIEIWNLDAYEQWQSKTLDEETQKPITSVAITPNDERIAISAHKSVIVLNLQTAEELCA